MRDNSIQLSVLYNSGMRMSVPVTDAEYDRLFDALQGVPEGHSMMLVGNSIEGLPFKINIVQEAIIWSEGGTIPEEQQAGCVQMTIGYINGTKAEITVPRVAYQTILNSFGTQIPYRTGISPNGHKYRVNMHSIMSVVGLISTQEGEATPLKRRR